MTISKKILTGVLILISSFLAIVIIFGFLIYTAPRHIPFGSLMLNTFVMRPLFNATVETESITASWDSDEQALVIQFYKIDILLLHHNKLSIPKMKLCLSLRNLLLPYKEGVVGGQSVEIDPNMTLTQVKNSAVSKLIGPSLKPSSVFPFAKIYDYILKHQGTIVQIGELSEDITVNLLFSPDRPPLPISVQKITIRPIRYGDHTSLAIETAMNIANELTIFTFSLEQMAKGPLNIKGTLQNINPLFMVPLFMAGFVVSGDSLHKFNFVLEISFNMTLSAQAEIESLEFQVLNHAKQLPKGMLVKDELPIDAFKIQGGCTKGCAVINFDSLMFKSGPLEVGGQLIKDKNHNLSGQITLKKMNAAAVWEYWPNAWLPDLKEWLKNHLHSAELEKADIDLSLDLPQVYKGLWGEQDAVHATLLVKDAIFSYMENVPKLHAKKIVVEITPQRVLITAGDLEVLGMKAVISDFSGLIDDLSAISTGLGITAKVNGSLQELIDMSFAHAGVRNDILLQYKGDAVANLRLFVPFANEITLENLGLQVDAQVQNLSTPQFLGKYSLQGNKVEARFKDLLLEITGNDISVNSSLSAQLSVKYDFTGKNPFVIQLDANSNAKNFRQAKIDLPNWVEEEVRLSCSSKATKTTLYSCLVDLQNSLIDFKLLGLRKNIGVPARLGFQLSTNAGFAASTAVMKKPSRNEQSKLHTIMYELDSPDLASSGTIIIDANFKNLREVRSASSRLHKGGFAFQYKAGASATALNVEAKTLDLSTLEFSKLKSIWDNNEGKNKKAFQLTSNLEKVILKNGMSLIKPKLEINCGVGRCKSAYLLGNFASGSHLNVFFDHPVLSVVASDAGHVFQAFDIYNNMSGGVLELKGKFGAKEVMSGHIDVSDFYIQKAPALAKLLTISALTSVSLKGVADLLQGKGIGFSNLRCDIEYASPALYLKDCRIKGSVLGIKASSVVNFNNKNTVKAAGVIVPVNIVNTFAQTIPVFGKLISGGKDNGIISTNFYMNGTLGGDLQVAVNPLSLLTPGIFGEIFNQERSIMHKP